MCFLALGLQSDYCHYVNLKEFKLKSSVSSREEMDHLDQMISKVCCDFKVMQCCGCILRSSSRILLLKEFVVRRWEIFLLFCFLISDAHFSKTDIYIFKYVYEQYVYFCLQNYKMMKLFSHTQNIKGKKKCEFFKIFFYVLITGSPVVVSNCAVKFVLLLRFKIYFHVLVKKSTKWLDRK